MSKDNTNLRLLGSPVNLFYRSKKKDDKKNIRNRPRSALLNSNPSSPDIQERFRRPFSADAKERAHSTRSFYKSFSSELLQSYNNSNPSLVVRVLPPTTELLGDTNANLKQAVAKDKDICSNASDYGSEDTYISLGTKIKARAQLGPKGKVSNKSNHLKYRNIAKKSKKAMENVDEEKVNNDYGVEVKIIERPPSQSPTRSVDILQEQPAYQSRAYESYFIPLEHNRKMDDNDLAGRVSFGKPSIQAEVEQAIDTYSRRLTLTRQQLSLVEEESTQDVTESNYSQPMSSLSPENPSEGNEKVTGYHTEEEYPRKPNFLNDSRTYSSFYDKFRFNSMDSYKPKSPSAVMYNDSSSKDSGYPDSGPNDDKAAKHNYSLPSSSLIKKSQSHDKLEEQPKSLDSVSTNSNDKIYKTYPLDRGQWAEPLNHSRLLYKDFFLKKEGHVALPPENSPINSNRPNVSSSNDVEPVAKSERNEETVDYPPYLRNSTTKAYTSQVIEDYKKELEAINNLHELTLKDIKTDTISPTPLNIDKMFENYASFDSKDESSASNSQELVNIVEVETRNKNSLEHGKTDISKVSTKELIQNYFKVKEDYGKELPNKNVKKTDRKLSNISARVDTNVFKHEWNNKNSRVSAKSPIPVSFRNITKKNAFTVTPVSARTEDVQHDKDVDSWMSMSAPSPSFLEVDIEETKDRKPDIKQKIDVIEEKEAPKAVRVSPRPIPETISSQNKEIAPQKELSANSTVLDIYSMLKEIESFGDNPVTSVSTADIPVAESEAKEKKEDRTITPKDNFMEIFEFLEKVEQSANDALSVVTSTVPQTIPKLEALLRLPQTELAQRLVTASLQLEERSCCIALLQESLTNHKEQMVQKVSSLEKQSLRSISKVKQECEDAIKRHQAFIDQLISDKKTLNHRIEQLVDERRALEERWRRAAQALEDRYKLELRNQHDKMAAAQQVARQRWVRQKAEKIKELTVKGLEGELREMAERQQKEISDLKMYHAEHAGRLQAKHSAELEALRRTLEEEKEAALVKERQMASARLEKQILELEGSYQAQRSRLVAEMRAENERRASGLCRREQEQRAQIEQWREEQEKIISEKRMQLEQEIAKERQNLQEQMLEREKEIEKKYEQQKKEFEAEQQVLLKKKLTDISAQHKMERDREIEKAIESMEAEAQAGRRELQEALRRNKEQYEAELRELAETERATLRRQQDAQARARAAEDRCAELEVAVNQLETRNKVLTDKNNQLETQGDSIKAQCEESWRATVESLKKEMEDLKKIHEEQMHQLYAKVKVAVARKDSAIQALTRENSKHQEKAATLEQKLQLQRKDFLKQK